MKRIIPSLGLAVFLASCGVPQEEFDKLNAEFQTLKTENEQLKSEIKELQETPSALLTRAESAKTEKRYEEAISLLNTVLAKAPDSAFSTRANEELATIETLKMEDAINGYLSSGDKMVENNQFDDAIVEYKKIIEEYPKSKHVATARARIVKTGKDKANAWIDLGSGLSYRKVGFRNQMGMFTSVYGELKNESGNDMSVAMLTISVYDTEDTLLGNGHIAVNNFPKNRVTNFSGIIQVPTGKIANYKLQFDSGM